MYLGTLLICWLFSLSINIISEIMFLIDEFIYPGKDNIIMNSLYSFWFNDIMFVISFAIITILLLLWIGILVGITKIKNKDVHEPTLSYDGVRILIIAMSVVLAVGTIIVLAVFRPYCFPSFHNEDKNDQCVSDNTNLRIYQYRWATFGIRCFVILPILLLILYIWNSLRSGTDGVSLAKLLMYRQMMEVLFISQILLFFLQTLVDWVVVFFPHMTYSNYKNMRLVCTTIPNILIIGVTIFLLRRIKGKGGDDGTGYQEMGDK